MSRLARAVIEILRQEWPEDSEFETPKILGRRQSVVEDLGTSDVIKVVESGDPGAEPMGFKHTHEDVNESIVVQIWATTRRVDGVKIQGRERVFGTFSAYEDAKIGGLAAVTRSVLQDLRGGFGPYDFIDVGWPIDNSDMAGMSEFRADISIQAGQHARKL